MCVYVFVIQENVEGVNCDTCNTCFYDLSVDYDDGCRRCFCFGISTVGQSAGLGLVQVCFKHQGFFQYFGNIAHAHVIGNFSGVLLKNIALIK